ncbi:hypothetical protein [Luteimonas salinilitoris]|uniref:Uncharacterized protein n=1 Tax=Luteimonas salinilitoris TaxID=3237697 RepID=A0ABV4HTQ0_9GAMM
MPEIHIAQSWPEFKIAYETFVDSIQPDKDNGRTAIAKQCINGLAMFWEQNVRRGERYLYVTNGDAVEALARIQVEPESVKLQDVVGYAGSGALLVDKTIEIAREEGKPRVWLEAADARVGEYYAKYFQFVFVNPRATSGRMERDV